MQGTHANLWGNFDMFCGTKNTWNRLCILNRVNDTVWMLEYICIIKRWDLSHRGCEVVVVKAKCLCYIQTKVDTDDADHKFNNIWKANKKIWRPSLLAIIGRWITTTISLFHGGPHSSLTYGIFGKLSHPYCPSQSIFPSSTVQSLVPLFGSNWMSLAHEEWYLCRFAYKATYITAYVLCSVSLLTMAAISVDKLLALLSEPRYRQIVTLKRTYCMVATFWVLLGVAGLCYILDYRIDTWCGRIIIPSCLIISAASFTKIFCVLSHHQAQVEQQQQGQPNPLNILRYKKAVYSALWVQLALVGCYLPIGISGIVIASSNTYSSHLFITWRVALVLFYFNSALNPVLYCWRISEMKQAVKQTISQALCCPLN